MVCTKLYNNDAKGRMKHTADVSSISRMSDVQEGKSIRLLEINVRVMSFMETAAQP